jgi:prolyl-tRNA synthetase
LAVVTYVGGKKLEEPVVVRPTSETVIGGFMAKWVNSHRDLPLLLNQWSNVVRWELRPRIFLRTSEFLWQEGHTAHTDEADASAYAQRILHEVYGDFMRRELAIPVIAGRKTARERFAGATNTMTLEAMTGDGKALQMGTSHELGQNFARAFDIGYTAADQSRRLAWTTSWGVSTRMVGGLIMTHGDDDGLRVPPRLAATQAVVCVVKDGEGVARAAQQVLTDLAATGVRAELDDRVDTPFGRRAVDWELKGVPVRVEIGPRDLAAGSATLVRRIAGTKESLPLGQVVAAVPDSLEVDQKALYAQAEQRQRAGTVDVGSAAEALEAAATGWARMPWAALGTQGEAALAEHAVTVRCLVREDGSLPGTEDEPGIQAVVGRSY